MNNELQHEGITAALRAFNKRRDAEQFPNLRAPVIAALDAYRETALPELTTREQLTATPEGTVLADRRATVWQKINGHWYTPGSAHKYADQSVMLPATTLQNGRKP